MKKVFCLLLSLVLAMSLLGACKSTDPEKNTSTSSDNNSSSAAGQNEPEPTGDDTSIVDNTAENLNDGSDEWADTDSGEEIEEISPEDTENQIETLIDPLQLNVFNSETPISTKYRGYSGTVHSAFHYMDDAYGRNYTPKMLQTELNRLDTAGIKYVRSAFRSSWMWNTATESYDWTTERFNNFVSFGKDMQSKGISIILHMGWHCNFIIENPDVPETSLGEQTYHKGRGDDKYGESSGYDFTGYSENQVRLIKGARRYGYWYAEAIRQLRARGVNNIDYLLYFTEPWGDWKKIDTGFFDDYILVCKSVKEKLTEEGIANTVKHIGPNPSSYTSEGLLDYVLEKAPDLFDIISAHSYPRAARATDDIYYDIMSNAATSYIDAVKKAGIYPQREFWVDETYVKDYASTPDAGSDNQIANNAWYGLQLVFQGIVNQQRGINQTISWFLIDQRWDSASVANSGESWHGMQFVGSMPALVFSPIPREQYYFHNLFVRYNGYQNGTVYRTNLDELAESYYGVYIGAVKLEDGSWTVTVLNLTAFPETVVVNFDKAINQTLYRHKQTAGEVKADASAKLAGVDKVYTSVKDKFCDVVPGGTVAIYTGLKG